MKKLSQLFIHLYRSLRSYSSQGILSPAKRKLNMKKKTTEIPSDHVRSTPSNPVVIIFDQFNNAEQASVDQKTFDLIQANINEPDKLRNFDCLFLSKTKYTAKMFRDCLQHNQGYQTEKPHSDKDGWIIHAIKVIPFPELRDTLANARKLAKVHSSELIDWMFELGYSLESSSCIPDDPNIDFPDHMV